MPDVLFTLLIWCIAFGAIWWILTLLPLPHPVGMIARIVVTVIFLIFVLNLFFGLLSTPRPGIR